MPEKLMNAPNTTALTIKKPVNVLAGIPKPCGWPNSDNFAGDLEYTCANAVMM